MPSTLTEEAKVSPSAVQPETDPAATAAEAPRANGHGPGIATSPLQPGSDSSWRIYRQASSWLTEPIAPPPALPSGPAMAAILGAGIGAAGLGVLITAAETIGPLKTALILDRGVGPLSGKTTVAVAVWLVAWVVLHRLWRARDVDSRRVTVATAALVCIGLLGTFPYFFDAVATFFGG